MAGDPASPDPRQHPYGSIVERYRGTEWDSTPPPPPPPPRGPRMGLLAFLLVAVVGISVMGMVIVLNLPREADTAAPVNPIRPGNVKPPDSIRIVEAFWQTVRAKDLTYRLEASGEAHGAGVDQEFTLSLLIKGDDYEGTVNTIGGSGEAELVRVGGVVWIRSAARDWAPIRTDDVGLRQSPFMGLEGRRELKYDAKVAGTTPVEHRLASTQFYRPSVARMLDLAAFTFRDDLRTLELFVDDDGVPLRAFFTSTMAADPTLNQPAFEGSATYTFSDFGIDAEIVAPTAP